MVAVSLKKKNVVAINANLFMIVDGLWKNQVLSGQVAAMADEYVSSHPNAGKVSDTTVAAIKNDIDELKSTGIPLGWEKFQNNPRLNPLVKANWIGWTNWTGFKRSWPGMILGWILMAFFVSEGAPFWFQILSKLVDLRKTGIKPKLSVKAKK